MARALIARPRLDCSFKRGPVPAVEGPPLNDVLSLFGKFIDNLEAHFAACGWEVVSDKKPLWQFELAEMQELAKSFDLVLFPHKLASQFPIGSNALYYKTTPIPEFLTVDPMGWGASLSFVPVDPEYTSESLSFFIDLQKRIDENKSVFLQPLASKLPYEKDYLLFICQIPHDETIQFHSAVSVVDALAGVIDYAEMRGRRLLVKGHPANRKSMAQLRAMTQDSKICTWIEEASIHDCLAGAERVFMVNSGVGFEAMLHGKTVVHFGHAEYSNVCLRAEPNAASIAAVEQKFVHPEAMAGFLYAFFKNTILYNDVSTYDRIIGKYM
jgi:hypothetical protein